MRLSNAMTLAVSLILYLVVMVKSKADVMDTILLNLSSLSYT